jgi:hypothetical protein
VSRQLNGALRRAAFRDPGHEQQLHDVTGRRLGLAEGTTNAEQTG